MTGGVLALACVAILVGSVAQRTTGMGFALLSAPFLVLLLGPFDGVILVNVVGIATSVAVLLRVRADIEWRTYLWLVIPALVGILPGSVLAVTLDGAWLKFVAGTVLLVALALTVVVRRIAFSAHGPGARLVAGFVSGITNAAAGIGGPPISVYALVSHWSQRAFAATVQPYFITISVISVAAKLAIDPGSWPDYPWWSWLLFLAALVGGIALGDVVARRLPIHVARQAVFAIAVLGSALVAGTGLVELLTR